MTTKKHSDNEILSFLVNAELIADIHSCVLTSLPARTVAACIDRHDGSSFFVKKLKPAHSPGDSWLDGNAEIAKAIPSGVRPRTIHNRDGWFVSDYCCNSKTFKTIPDVLLTETLAKSLGTTLSHFHSHGSKRVHGGNRSGSNPQSRVRCMPALALQKYIEMPGLDRDIFVKFSQQCNIGIDRLSSSLERTCVIHGDLQGNNILIGSADHTPIHIVDWENAGMGDPTWDLGHFFASLIQRWVRNVENVPESLSEFLAAEQSTWTALSDWFASFAKCYWDQVDMPIRDLVNADKTLGVAGHAILERSANILHVYGRFTARDILLLSIAERLLANPRHSAMALVPDFKSWIEP